MTRLAPQVPPPNADVPDVRGRCAIASGWAAPDLQDMLDAAAESPATSAASAPATDELLSQLAGKEIDRLLASAGVEPATSPADAASTPAATAPIDGVAASTLDSAASMTAAISDAAITPPADGTAAIITNELDQIVARQLSEAVLGDVDAKAMAAAAPASDAALENQGEADEEKPEEAKSDGAAVGDLLNRLDAGERPPPPAPAAEPSAEAPAPATAAEPNAAESASEDSPDEITLPPAEPRGPTLVARVLDVVTIPLDPFPPGMRDVVGKIAIVTTLNALAVLIYVTFFRK